MPILLAGPTAVGKSAVALALAERLRGEIISVDSMQVYRGLDIGTAKPSLEERRRIPHHLVDILDLDQSFDASQFVARAPQAAAEIQARGRTPILCGGTGLYFKAFLEGLAVAPAADLELRRQLEATPVAALLEELRQRDPVSFEKIDHRNLRRIIRALEVIRLTGRPFSDLRQQATAAQDTAAPAVAGFFCLARGAEDLRTRLEARVDQMFRLGLVQETERLLAQGLAGNRTALQALGYRQVVEHLRGERALPETIALVKARTRQFARRQMTWFRCQAAARWVLLQPAQPLETVVDTLLALIAAPKA
jgi:tRNA dimethylallyltransferase